jgi:3-deoxy-7-phosphoheptulonate synthase
VYVVRVAASFFCFSIHLHTAQYDPLVQPALLRHEIVSSPNSKKTIASARYSAARILAGHDDRVMVIVGPCSIHSADQAIEYANLLKSKIPSWNNLLIIMRAYLYVVFKISSIC